MKSGAMDDKPPLLPILAACLATIYGGSAGGATRFAVGEVDVVAGAFLRCLGSAVVILLLVLAVLGPRALRGIAAVDLPGIVGLGLVQHALFGWVFAAGLSYIPAAR